MEKFGFALDIEDGWPPVAVEHVWCEKSGSVFELHNAPFFVKGLAAGDKFTAEPDPVNGCVFEFSVVETGGHSLVWVLESGALQFEKYKPDLLSLGCNVEGFPGIRLHAIDVPASVTPESASAVMDKLETLGFSLAYPVWRHEHESA